MSSAPLTLTFPADRLSQLKKLVATMISTSIGGHSWMTVLSHAKRKIRRRLSYFSLAPAVLPHSNRKLDLPSYASGPPHTFIHSCWAGTIEAVHLSWMGLVELGSGNSYLRTCLIRKSSWLCTRPRTFNHPIPGSCIMNEELEKPQEACSSNPFIIFPCHVFFVLLYG